MSTPVYTWIYAHSRIKRTQGHRFYFIETPSLVLFFKIPTTKEQYGFLRYAVLVPVTP